MADQEGKKSLLEQRLRVHKRMTEILEPSQKEERALSTEERANWDAAHAEFQSLTEALDARKEQDRIDAHMRDAAPHPAAAAVTGGAERAKEEAEEEYRSAFDAWIRRGASGLTAEQRSVLDGRQIDPEVRDMGVASGAAGGYAVPTGFLPRLVVAMKYFGGMRQVADRIETSSGNTVNWPTNDDTGNPAVIIGENTQVSELDLTLGQKTLGSYIYTTGAVRVSRALSTDAGVDIEGRIVDAFGVRFGRGQNTHFTKGTGTGQPQGIVGAATAASGVTTWDYAGIVGLKYSVDRAYRDNGKFMISDAAAKAALLLTDSAGRPLWVPAGSFGSLAAAGEDVLLGTEVVINNDLDAPATTGSKVPALYGDFKQAYIIRDVGPSASIMRLEERYADYFQVGFIGYMRSDGQPNNIAAVRKLVQPA